MKALFHPYCFDLYLKNYFNIACTTFLKAAINTKLNCIVNLSLLVLPNKVTSSPT